MVQENSASAEYPVTPSQQLQLQLTPVKRRRRRAEKPNRVRCNSIDVITTPTTTTTTTTTTSHSPAALNDDKIGGGEGGGGGNKADEAKRSVPTTGPPKRDMQPELHRMANAEESKSTRPGRSFQLRDVPVLPSPEWSSEDEMSNPEFNRLFRLNKYKHIRDQQQHQKRQALAEAMEEASRQRGAAQRHRNNGNNKVRRPGTPAGPRRNPPRMRTTEATSSPSPRREGAAMKPPVAVAQMQQQVFAAAIALPEGDKKTTVYELPNRANTKVKNKSRLSHGMFSSGFQTTTRANSTIRHYSGYGLENLGFDIPSNDDDDVCVDRRIRGKSNETQRGTPKPACDTLASFPSTPPPTYGFDFFNNSTQRSGMRNGGGVVPRQQHQQHLDKAAAPPLPPRTFMGPGNIFEMMEYDLDGDGDMVSPVSTNMPRSGAIRGVSQATRARQQREPMMKPAVGNTYYSFIIPGQMPPRQEILHQCRSRMSSSNSVGPTNVEGVETTAQNTNTTNHYYTIEDPFSPWYRTDSSSDNRSALASCWASATCIPTTTTTRNAYNAAPTHKNLCIAGDISSNTSISINSVPIDAVEGGRPSLPFFNFDFADF